MQCVGYDTQFVADMKVKLPMSPKDGNASKSAADKTRRKGARQGKAKQTAYFIPDNDGEYTPHAEGSAPGPRRTARKSFQRRYDEAQDPTEEDSTAYLSEGLDLRDSDAK